MFLNKLILFLQQRCIQLITGTVKASTFMHLADTFIQSDLQCIQVIHLFSLRHFVCSLGIEPTTFALQTHCSTTENIYNIVVFLTKELSSTSDFNTDDSKYLWTANQYDF